MTNQKTDSLVLEANSTTFSLNETTKPETNLVVKKRRVMKPKGPVSAETRKKMSVARIGMKLSKEHKENIGKAKKAWYDRVLNRTPKVEV